MIEQQQIDNIVKHAHVLFPDNTEEENKLRDKYIKSEIEQAKEKAKQQEFVVEVPFSKLKSMITLIKEYDKNQEIISSSSFKHLSWEVEKRDVNKNEK
jgi:hypothetical protein